MSDIWACPACDHALVPFYRRPWRRLWRKIVYQGCVSCGFERVRETA